MDDMGTTYQKWIFSNKLVGEPCIQCIAINVVFGQFSVCVVCDWNFDHKINHIAAIVEGHPLMSGGNVPLFLFHELLTKSKRYRTLKTQCTI